MSFTEAARIGAFIFILITVPGFLYYPVAWILIRLLMHDSQSISLLSFYCVATAIWWVVLVSLFYFSYRRRKRMKASGDYLKVKTSI